MAKASIGYAQFRVDDAEILADARRMHLGNEPFLEPLADAVAALNEIETLLPRLRPLRDAFERMNRYHGYVSSLEKALAAKGKE